MVIRVTLGPVLSPHRRRAAMAGTAAFVLAATAACSSTDASSSSDGSTVKVVLIADRTGALATTVGSSYLGVQAYVDKVNAEGGVDGKKVELTILDSASTPDTAQLQFRKAIEQTPSAILHAGVSGGVTASASLIEGNGIPVISLGAPDEVVIGSPGEIYQTGPSAPQIVSGSIAALQQGLGRSDINGVKIAQIGFETPYVDYLFELAEPAVSKAGGEIVESVQYPFGVPSFTAQAAKVLEAEPDGIFITGTSGDIPTVVGALKDAGFEGPIISGATGGGDDPNLIKRFDLPTYAAARFYAMPADSTEIASIAGSKNASNGYFTNGWVMSKVLLDSVERCECTDGATINEELQSGEDYTFGDLTFGPLSFTENYRAGLSGVQFFGRDDAGDVGPVGEPVDVKGAE